MTPSRKAGRAHRLWLAGALGVAAGLFAASEPGTFLNRLGLDGLFWLRHHLPGTPPHDPRPRVAVVVIDEEAYDAAPLRNLPQVAWTPQIAEVLEAVGQTSAVAVGMDLVFPTTLEGLVPRFDRPLRAAFARLARSERLVLGAIDSAGYRIEPERGLTEAAGGRTALRPLQLLLDEDNVVREHLAAWTNPDGSRVVTFVGELAHRAGAAPPPDRFVINYLTDQAALPVYGFADLLLCSGENRAAFLEEAFGGRVVIFGTALDVEDRWIPAKRFVKTAYRGPTQRCTDGRDAAARYDGVVERRTYPGAFIHAEALDTVLRQRRLTLASPLESALAVGGIVAGATAGFLSLGPVAGVATLGLVLLAVFGAGLAFMVNGIVVPVTTLAGALVLAAGLVYAFRFVEELRERRRSEAEKRRLADRFGRFLAPAIIERLDKDPDSLRLGGDRRRVTVFFADLVGYTTISEALRDEPERLVEIANGYFAVMVAAIERHGGYVDKFIGDAVMAVWGAPLPQEEQERCAVDAALESLVALRRFSDEVVVGRYGLPPIDARIGINTGEAIVGNMGSPERLNYTVTGDTVNLASRLEGANKAYGTRIMLGPQTADAVADRFVLRPLDLLIVKGRNAPVRVFEALGRLGEIDDAAQRRLTRFLDALRLYGARCFHEAGPAFDALAAEDPVAAIYAERSRRLGVAPPGADWDGSYALLDK